MMKNIMAGIVLLCSLSISASANQMSASPSKKGFELPTDIEGSRRDYQKQSRVSYAKPETTPVADTPSSTEKPAQAEPTQAEPIVQTGANTQRRSGGMRY